jgi:Tfp pilus assembly protein PilO
MPVDPRFYFAIAVGSGAFVAVLILSIFVIRPLIDKSLNTAKDLKYRTEEASQLTTKLSNLKTLKENFLALPTDAEGKILVAMPTDPDEPHLTSLLSTVAGESGVQLKSISYQVSTSTATAQASTSSGTAVTPSVNAQNLPVTLAIEGPYANIVSFITNIEKAPRIIDVTSMNISGTSPDLSANLDVSAYYSPAGGTGTTTGTTTGTATGTTP